MSFENTGVGEEEDVNLDLERDSGKGDEVDLERNDSESRFTGWTLFLDRDGVINRRLVGTYVKKWEEFEFTHRALEAIKIFKEYFDTIVVVTNQQCIGKGELTTDELDFIHNNMVDAIVEKGGAIDKVYYCPNLKAENAPCRKPNPGMGWQAKKDFPTIHFQKSIMVGDSFSDMEFGWQLGTKTIFIEGKDEESERTALIPVDGRFENLYQFAEYLNASYGEIFDDLPN